MTGTVYLRVKDVAKMLGIGTSTVWEWSRKGKLPKAIKQSPRVSVWKLEDIARYQQKADEASIEKTAAC